MAWYDSMVAEHGDWIRRTRPTRREIQKALGCGSHRAATLQKMAFKGKVSRKPRILTVGDAHFEPGQDMERAHILGRFAADKLQEGDHIVIIGDWWGLTSICTHLAIMEAEGLRVAEDIKAGQEAARIFMSYLDPDNMPEIHFTVGNHEIRIERLAEERPAFTGLVGLHSLGIEEFGWNVVPFLEPLRIQGWRFQHFFGSMRYPIRSKKYPARRIIDELGTGASYVYGHTHRFALAGPIRNREGDQHSTSVNVGCFFTHKEDYAGEDRNYMWWRGLVLIEGVDGTRGDVVPWSMERLIEGYGS